MQQTAIFSPFIGMLVLTMLVWVYMFIKRLSYFSANKIDPEQVSTPDKLASLVPEHIQNPANNFKNLFEVPILFYVICLFLYSTNQVDQIHIYCAYAFFVFRALHSIVHCTFNKVMARFVLYVVSSIALWAMIIRAAL